MSTAREVYSAGGWRVVAEVDDDGRFITVKGCRPFGAYVAREWDVDLELKRKAWWYPPSWGFWPLGEAVSRSVQWVERERADRREASARVNDAIAAVEGQKQVARIVADMDRTLAA